MFFCFLINTLFFHFYYSNLFFFFLFKTFNDRLHANLIHLYCDGLVSNESIEIVTHMITDVITVECAADPKDAMFPNVRVKILFLEIYKTQLLLLTRTNIFVCLICFFLLFESFSLLSSSLLPFPYVYVFLSLSSFYRSLSSLYRHLFYIVIFFIITALLG